MHHPKANDMNLKDFWKKIYSTPMRIARRRRHGLPALMAFKGAMQEAGIPWTPVYGTLLGAIREKGFIKHDEDLDIGVWNDNIPGGLESLHQAMLKAGFRYRHSFLVDGGAFAREETWTWNGLHLDIFFFDTLEGGMCRGYMFFPFKGCRNVKQSIKEHGGLRVVSFDVPLSPETEEVPFESTTVPVTKSAEMFVVTRYGTSWRIPDPTFVYPYPGATPLEDCPGKIALKEV